MNSRPRDVANAFQAYLDDVDRVVAEEVTDAEIEARLQRLTADADGERRSEPHVGSGTRRAESELRSRNAAAVAEAGVRAVILADPLSGASSDEQLVTSINRDFGGPLLAHALRLTGNDRAWAEDVVQETLVRAWRNADRLQREPDMLRSWLYTVAQKIVVDGRRSVRARPREVDVAPLLLVPVPDTSELALSAMIIADALRGLRPEHREVLEETYLRDRTFNEAAQVLGLPPGTVKSRVFYALRALRRALREDE